MSTPNQVEVLLSGIGGQGIQLAAKTLALAATREGMEVMLSASYGAEIRGGHSDATVCMAPTSLRALPIAPSASHALVMHDMSWSSVSDRLRQGGIAVVNSSLAPHAHFDRGTVVPVAADDLAASLDPPGNPSFFLLGAFAGFTGLVGHDALHEAMVSLVPRHRRTLLPANTVSLRAGYEAGRSLDVRSGS